MSDTIRSFIAIELNKTLQEGLHQIQRHLQTCHPDVKWVDPTNIHLTLKFLGDVPLLTIQTIVEQLPSWVTGICPFQIALNMVGAFPRVKQPRVIWAGVPESHAQSIGQLADAIEKGVQILGFEKERKTFIAHVTIGRVRSGKNIKALAEMLVQHKIPHIPSQTVRSVSLFRSTLTPQGPIYEMLSKVML